MILKQPTPPLRQARLVGKDAPREGERVIAAYVSCYGYVRADSWHRGLSAGERAELEQRYSYIDDDEFLEKHISYPKKGYVTSYGRLISYEFAVQCCLEADINCDYSHHSGDMKERLKEDFDIRKAQRFCDEHNRKIEIMFKEYKQTNKQTNKLGGMI